MPDHNKSLVGEGLKFSCFRYNLQYLIFVLSVSSEENYMSFLECKTDGCVSCPLADKSELWGLRYDES